MKLPFATAAALLAALLLTGCPRQADGPEPTAEPEAGLTAFQLEHGIGPFVDEVVLRDEIDRQLAAQGEAVFAMNCAFCHQMEGRLAGPPLGDVLARRSPTFILNFIMNPEEMAREHPEGQAMLREYMVVMPYQNITEEQARAILEYLRTQQR